MEEWQKSVKKVRGWDITDIERCNFQERLNFRMFSEECTLIDKIIRYSMDGDGFRKYENRSHFVRCAVLKLLRAELPLQGTRGRPKKTGDKSG